MKKAIFFMSALAVVFSLCLIEKAFCQEENGSQMASEKVLTAGKNATKYYPETADMTEGTAEEEKFDKATAVYIPKEWGTLKAVSWHQGVDLLYFEAQDGTIYVVTAEAEEDGDYLIHADDVQVAKILRK